MRKILPMLFILMMSFCAFGVEEIILEDGVVISDQMEKDDVFYIASDGFVDQNGGEKDKKFRPQAFRQMLMEIQHLNLEGQKEKILNILNDWMGEKEQRDDIVVIGVKV